MTHPSASARQTSTLSAQMKGRLWLIIKHEDGEDRIYMIRETKSTLDESKRRPSENAKIKAAQAHFAAIGVVDYGVSVPDAWGI